MRLYCFLGFLLILEPEKLVCLVFSFFLDKVILFLIFFNQYIFLSPLSPCLNFRLFFQKASNKLCHSLGSMCVCVCVCVFVHICMFRPWGAAGQNRDLGITPHGIQAYPKLLHAQDNLFKSKSNFCGTFFIFARGEEHWGESSA